MITINQKRNTFMQKSESGSAHVIIIAVLAVVLIGALGFIFWQNFIQAKPSDNVASTTTGIKTDSTQTKEEVKATPTDPNEGYLVIDSWNVRFKPASAAKVSYVQKGEGYWLTTDKWKNLGGVCAADGGVLLIRSTQKSTVLASPPLPLNNEQKIGDYYYYYYTPQGICTDNHADQEEPELETMKTVMATIEAKK